MSSFGTLKKTFGNLQKKFAGYFDDAVYLNAIPSRLKKKLQSDIKTKDRKIDLKRYETVVDLDQEEDQDYNEQRTKVS